MDTPLKAGMILVYNMRFTWFITSVRGTGYFTATCPFGRTATPLQRDYNPATDMLFPDLLAARTYARLVGEELK